MTEEIKPVITPTTPEPKKMIEVDVFGISVPLEADIAKQLIEKRDNRLSVFKDLDAKVKAYEAEKEDLSRRLAMSEKVKAGSLAEAEQIASQKVNDKLSKLTQAIVLKEIKSELVRNQDFIGTDVAISDTITLIKDRVKYNDETGEVVSTDGKPIKDFLTEFLSTRDNLKKAKSVPSTGASLFKQSLSNIQPQKTAPNLSAAIGKFFNGK